MGPHKKYNSNGSILKYEVQLLAWKFFQEPRIDYHETFCHVIKLSSLVILFSFLQPWILKFIRWMSIWLFKMAFCMKKYSCNIPKTIYNKVQKIKHAISYISYTIWSNFFKYGMNIYGLKKKVRLYQKQSQTNDLKLNKSMAPIIVNDVITMRDVPYKIVGSFTNVTVCTMVDLEHRITTKCF